MNTTLARLITILITLALLSPVIVHAGSKSHQPLTEDAAFNLLFQTLKRDHVYDKRVSLDCVTLSADETTRIYFEIGLREKHGGKCGGDPDLSPIVDRYRVYKATGKIEWFNVIENNWLPYNPERIGKKTSG